MTTIREIQKIIKFNSGVLGMPDLIDKNHIDSSKFIVSENIVQNSINYFEKDPLIWELPAKNYFVRICLAKYINIKYGIDFYIALNENSILPYDDLFSPIYSEDKTSYDKIISSVPNIENTYGYKKTIEIFGYLYENPLKPITVGYNLTGQEFFDIISLKKKYISEFYFSLTHGMRLDSLNTKLEIKTISSCDQYGIPSNILFNIEEDDGLLEEQIKIGKEISNLKSVTVVNSSMAKQVRELFPELTIHLSTHGSMNVKDTELTKELFDVVNVPEPWYFSYKDKIKICKEEGIKIKYIGNRGCITNKLITMNSIIPNEEFICCKGACEKAIGICPWLLLCRSSISKEMLTFDKNIDIIKLSTRDVDNDTITNLLRYWTTIEKTRKYEGMNIPEEIYPLFVKWSKYKITNCKGDCKDCLMCKKFYDKLDSQKN